MRSQQNREWLKGPLCVPAIWLDEHGPLLALSDLSFVGASSGAWGTARFEDAHLLLFMLHPAGTMLMLGGPERGVEERMLGECPDREVRDVWAELVQTWISELRDGWE